MSGPAVVAKPLKLLITVTKGPSQGPPQEFTLPLLSIGRGPENQIVLANDPKVSRNHIELHVSPTNVFLRNLSQKNPVAINGEIAHEKVLSSKTLIAIGDSEVTIEMPNLVPQVAVPSVAALKVVAGQGTKSPIPQSMNSASVTQFQAPSSFGQQSGGFSQTAPTPKPENPIGELLQNPKARFYLIVGVIGLAFVYLFTGGSSDSKKALKLRDSVQSNEDFFKSEAEVNRIKDNPSFKARDTIQFQKAEEHFTRAFRDYRNGQYSRAIEGFQAALSFFPSHELARRYYTQAVRKFDQMVQMHMVRGRQYYGKKNYRLCMAEFRSVVIMKKDPRDTVRKEALQLYEECRLRLEEGR